MHAYDIGGRETINVYFFFLIAYSESRLIGYAMSYFHYFLTFLFELFLIALPQPQIPTHEVGITIDATPISAFETDNPLQHRFGALEFRGGLVLTSTNDAFGGLSALRVESDGEHFIALSDRATWLRGRIVYKGNRPVAIDDAAMAPVLDDQGKPALRWDTESITADGDTVYVGLERIHSIIRFDYGKKGIFAGGKPVAVPPEMKDLPSNQSLEAIAYVSQKSPLKGTLIALSERGLTPDGNIKAFLVGGQTPGLFSVKRTDGYDISDAAILPCGDLLILERQYSLDRGVSMRIRRIQATGIKPGALVDGPTIIEADARHEIDNMEALSVHRLSSGEIIITILSDNNLSPLQRTILLQFTFRDK